MRIIVVEDSKKLAHSLKRGLESEGYAVDCLYDGKLAKLRLEIHYKDYDLVILDIMLPGIDGISLCKEIRKQKIEIPILMLTAKDSTNDKILGLDIGADDYLVKPFSFKELLARIRAILRRPKNVLQPELKVKDLVLNTVNRKVFRGSKEIVLTLKEFRLLEYFMRNADRALTREDILSSLWDFNMDSFSNVVDVHIKNLRKKVDYGKKEKLFQTIWGVGYKLKK